MLPDAEAAVAYNAMGGTSMTNSAGIDLSPSAIDSLLAGKDRDIEKVREVLAICRKQTAAIPAMQALSLELERLFAEYGEARDRMINKLQAARALWNDIDAPLREMRDNVGTGAEFATQRALLEIESKGVTARRTALMFLGGCLAAFVVFLFLLNRHLIRPMRWNARKFQEIQQGNLEVPRREFVLREVAEVSDLLDSLSEHLAGIYSEQAKLKLDSAQMRGLEQLMRAVFKASVDGYCVWSPDSLKLANRQLLRLMGVAGDGLPDGPINNPQILPFERSRQLYERVLERQLVREEQVLTDLHGAQLPCEVTSVMVRMSDGVYVLSYFRDLREQKRHESELRRAKEQAEAAAEAKSNFLARMGHEIRTPMNGVLGLTQLALQKSPPAEQAYYFEKIRNSARILARVIKDVLVFSSLGSGHYQLDNNSFSLDRMLGTVADNIAPLAAKKGLGFVVERGEAIPDQLYGDELRIAQVLLNLCDNAVKFTCSGRVLLRVEPNYPNWPDFNPEDAENRELALSFSVSDTGIGIDRSRVEEIFQAFTQADSSNTRLHEGMGLGLAIVWQLVRLMGGRVEVESRPGNGSTFSFTLRLQRASAGNGAVPGSSENLFWDDGAGPEARQGAGLMDGPAGPADLAGRFETLAPGENVSTLVAGRMTSLMTGYAEPAPASASGNMPTNWPEEPSGDLPEKLSENFLDQQEGSAGAGCEENKEAIPSGAPSPSSPASPSSSMPVEASLGEPAADAVPEPGAALQGKRVLLVEDNPLNQEIAASLLEQAGMRVTVADDGAKALESLAREDADIVLMDIQMPVMDGLTATQRIRADGREEVRGLPILAMTAHGLPEDREKCFAAGMNDHISKPVDVGELYAKVALWLD